MIFYDFVILSGLFVGTIVGILYYRVLPLDSRILAWFFFLTLSLELMADYRMIVHHKNNLLYYHIMTIMQFVLLSLYFKYNIVFLRISNDVVYVVFVVCLLEIILLLTFQPFDESPSWIRLISRIFLLYWVLLYFKSLLIEKDTMPLLSIPTFWVCIGICFHFMSFLQVGLMRYLITYDRQLALYWYRFSIWTELIFHLICTYALFIPIRKYKKNKHNGISST